MAENERTWTRDEISSCSCAEKSYRHVHCPCLLCKGKATSRSTELRHWSQAQLFAGLDSDIHEASSEHEDSDDFDHVNTENEEHVAENTDSESEEHFAENTEGRGDHGEENCFLSEPEPMDTDPSQGNEDRQREQGNANPLRKLIVKAVLDALTIAEDSGASIKTFEDILDYGKKMLFTSLGDDIDIDILTALWPNSWNAAQVLLKEEGFSDAKEYYICICREKKETTRSGKTSTKYHYNRLWSIMESKHHLCAHCGKKGYIKYYYLGLNNKVKNWFRNETMCKQMLSHWEEREHWLGRTSSWPVKKEIWDGQRWVDLQWFWDPNKTWTLPTRCISCNAIISAETLSECAEDDNGISQVNCPECFETFPFKIKRANGSPLNLALIGHWDAWQPFRTSFRSCGSIEISIANMYKKDRAHVKEVYVVGFVPCTTIPNEVPEAFDPFLEPLMNDLSMGFIDGFQVPYPFDFSLSNFEPGEITTVRVLLLCWTADHPGQCEFGKILNQGKCGCRRCKLIGMQSEHSYHYYYGDNRLHCRYPWDMRNIKHEEENLFNADSETRKTARKKESSQSGFTGTSLLHKYLYPLYGFDILHHMVFDIFHTIPLNLCKNQVQRLLELELLDKTYFDEQISTFPWTAELKSGRLPVAVGKEGKGLGYWKAEGFQKFAYPMFECIAEGKLKNLNELEILSAVSRFTELHFHSGRDGWSDEMIQMHKKLAQRINVKIEEVQGLDMCSISVHNMLHVHEDILNFSATDNYWCAVFERAVKDYIKRSNNCKGVEGTFAKAEARREYLKSIQGQEVDYNKGYDTNQGVVRSVEIAKIACLSGDRNSLLLGTKGRFLELTPSDHEKIATALSISQTDVSRVSTVSRKCFVNNLGLEGMVISGNDTIIILLHGTETVVSIDRFLSVRCEEECCQLLGEGTVKQFLLDDNGQRAINILNGFPKVQLKPDGEKVFFPIKDIQRKVMLYPCGEEIATVVDYMRKLTPYEVIVPSYPEEGDMLLIQGEQPVDIWHGRVLSIDRIRQTVDVFFFIESTQQPHRFVRETFGRGARNSVSFESIIAVADGDWSSTNCWLENV